MAGGFSFGNRTFHLHVYIAALFLGLLIAFAAITISTQNYLSRSMMLSSAETLFTRIGQETKQSIDAIYAPAKISVELLSKSILMDATTLEVRLSRLPLLVAILENHPEISAAYVGYQDGDFFLVRRFNPDSYLARALSAPKESAYVVQSISRDAEGLRDPRFFFYSDKLEFLASKPVPNYDFDPRARPWFQEAIARIGTISTDPYLFYTTREVGATVAKASESQRAVVGIDVTLGVMSDLLKAQRPTPSAQLFVFNDKGDVMADTDSRYRLQVDELGTPSMPKLGDLGQPLLTSVAKRGMTDLDHSHAYEIGGEIWQGILSSWTVDGAPYYIAIAAPQKELLADAARIRNIGLWISLGLLLLAIPFTIVLSRLASGPLKALIHETRAVQALKFDEPIKVRSFIFEIDKLARSMDAMKSTIRRLLQIGSVLGAERSFDRLLDRILSETTSVTNARGGLIYLQQPEGHLTAAHAYWDGQPRKLVRRAFDPVQDAEHPVIRAFNGENCAVTMSVED
ncbi:MAG: hypothetical protein ACREFM_00725, partial [Hypericibacter sp.]